MNPERIYPRTNDHETVYLKSVVKNSNIIVGDFTMYNDFVKDPRQFEKNNVLYYYPINHDKLVIGKFCSIACGAKFLFTSANHISEAPPPPEPYFPAGGVWRPLFRYGAGEYSHMNALPAALNRRS